MYLWYVKKDNFLRKIGKSCKDFLYKKVKYRSGYGTNIPDPDLFSLTLFFSLACPLSVNQPSFLPT
jgi:hypothetical protein